MSLSTFSWLAEAVDYTIFYSFKAYSKMNTSTLTSLQSLEQAFFRIGSKRLMGGMDDSQHQKGGTILGNTFVLNFIKKQAFDSIIPLDMKIKKYGIDV